MKLDDQGRYPEPIGPESPATRQGMADFARRMLRQMDEEDGNTAMRDVLAAIGFVFAERLDSRVLERLANPDARLVEDVFRVAVIRWKAIEGEEEWSEENPRP